MSKLITPEHISARFMICELDGETVTKVACVDPDNQLITLYSEQQEFTYTDKEGNSTTIVADNLAFAVEFKARQFKVYDEVTNEVYAEWNTYGN